MLHAGGGVGVLTKPLHLLTKPLPLLTKPLLRAKHLNLLTEDLHLLTKPHGAMQHGGGGAGVRAAWKLRVGEE